MIPRIRNIIYLPNDRYDPEISRAQAETGRKLLRSLACEYFAVLAETAPVPMHEKNRWLNGELDTFMHSMVPSLFACLFLNLGPFIIDLTARNDQRLAVHRFVCLFVL